MKTSTVLEEKAVIIGIGEYNVGDMPMASVGLGSCIALVIHDKRKSIGGMAHVMLPTSKGQSDRPGKFADTAVEVICTELNGQGSRTLSLEARLIGGAKMFQSASGALNIGDRNVEQVKAMLAEYRIPVIGEDIGGNCGRTILYKPSDNGIIRIKRADGVCRDL